MAHLDLDEQEQLATLKSWWSAYGTLVVGLLLAAAVAFSGWRGWQYWQARQSVEASALFEALTKAQQGSEAKAVRDASGELLEKYSGTLYASMGALTSAKYHFDRGDAKAAKAQLQWVIDKTGSEEFRSLARLRMANILLDEKAYDEALKLLEAKHGEAFETQYALLRGDILAAKGQAAEAKTAYQLALEKAAKKSGGVEAIQMRLDALGG